MKQRDFSPTGSRQRKKHKRLDAINENVYNQNHNGGNGNGEGTVVGSGSSSAAADSELRRSLRVRRAPVLLDASPPPVKKRRKAKAQAQAQANAAGKNNDKHVQLSSVNKNSRSRLAGSVVKEDEGERLLSLGHIDDDDEPLSSSWRSRLRSRGRNDFGRGESGQVSGKRKLFDDKEEGKGEDAELGEKERELGEKERDLDGGDMIEVRSFKRTERVKMMNELGSGENEGGIPVDENVNSMDDDEMQSDKDENGPIEKENGGLDEKQVLGNEVEDRETDLGGEMDVQNELEVEIEGKDVEAIPVPGGEIADGNEVEAVPIDVVQLELDAEDRTDSLDGLLSEKKSIGTDNVENVEQSDNNVGVHSVNDGETAVDEKVGVLMNEVDDFKYHDGEKGGLVKVDEIPLDAEKDAEGEKLNSDSIKTLDRSRIKQGRHCGLCGCGNDGKPPKKLVQHVGESENEAYSGSSASEDPNYDKWDGFGDEPGWLGRLLGPINDRYGIAGIWVHQHCAVWSPEVYFAGLGCLKNVRAALCRGRVLKCSRCGRPGATIGCRVDRCPKTYHLPCARSEGCIFDHRKFLIACIDHRHLFQPQGNQYLLRIKELKAKKMKLEMRKLSNDAWRKDVEAEEKWLENCGEDEEFLKRESKRLHRDLLRIAPVYIGGSNSESGNLFEGWESVAGLQDVIQCLKEVVILPLLYPEFFSDLGITPPRGVLLHGYPGTGKTLVVRALIGSCARGDKRIAYFARKGADCLGKYVGDAERQLRLLFQVAEKSQPSIIFFDEIDGLAPSRTRQQDQTHSSVVSTLLALMDGLKSRGSVVVIGATNRPEAVDPALRRPGRFDREIYFPLPSAQDRAAILSLHTKRWPKPVAGSLLHWISERTVGFAGADLQALCTQAAIIALKRNFPLQKFLSAAGEKGPASKRLPLPAFAVEERDWLEALACAPPPCSQREAGIAAYDLVSCPLPTHLIPCLLQPLSTLVVSLYLDERLWLPTPLLKAAKVIKSVMVSFLEKNSLPSDHWSSYVDKCLKEAAVANEVQRRLSSAGIIASGIGFCSTGAFTDENDNNSVQTETPMTCNVLKGTGFSRSICFMGKKSGFHVLISGSPRSGQRHLASCIMHCFVGNVEIKKVDLATVSQEGHGDMAQGITRILMKCAGLQSCMIFMPRIDLWAVERCHPLPEESNYMEVDSLLHQCKDAEMAEPQASIPSASHAWSLFIEQVESICVSTSLMILATSELPYSELPPKVNQFFKCDVTNTSQPIPLEHTIPQFSLHVDGNVNYDMMISLATTKLLGDIVQSFVQLIYQRTHSLTSSLEDYKIGDSIQGSFDAECHGNVHGSNNESEGKVECSRDSSFKVSPLPLSPAGNNRGLKGKSSLLLSMSTFGYQLLRYPHFAELCWVTSKLKEGPSADVSGPWKGWPFNSCIIRPGNSSDKVAVAFSSGNIKSKDKSGYVRGLVAVGLSAYRGVYTSVREVSFEVRKVLELLVGQVNEKIEAGKDQYQYLRLLSQVAYLEDMVNSWAHALYSLELDAQMKMGTLKQSPGEFSDKDACTVNSVQVTGQGFGPQNLERADATDRVYSDDPDPELPGPLSGSSKQSVVFGESNQDKHLQNSIANSYLIGNIMHEQNLRCTGQCEPENSGSLAVTIINSDSKNSDGCLPEEPIISTEIGHGSSGECVAHQVSSGPLNQINRWNSTRPDGCFLRKSVISAEICHGCSSEVCATCELCAPEVSGVPCNRSNGLGSGERGTHSVNPDPDSIELSEDMHYSPGTTTCLPGVVESGSQSNKLEPHSIEHMEGMHCSPGRATSLAGTIEEGSPLGSPESPSIEHTVEIRYSPCRTSSPMDAVERGTQSEHHSIEPDSIQHFEDKNCSPSKATSLSVDAGVVCLYRCCSGCLSTLWSTIRHILLHECPSTKNHWTVDDFHDAFASLSVDLISVVRKMGNTFDEDLTGRRPKGSYGHPRQHRCDCREGNTLAILKKCPCHPEGGCESAEASTLSDSLFGLDLKFVFRDGVLVLVESDKDLTFHCKYETLCLCSPIESMVMLKQPSER